MTWTYSGDPSSSPKDLVRFLCGDTDEAYSFISDEEIEYLLKQRPDPRRAAVDACDSILRTLAKEVDYTIGPESVKASQRFKAFEAIRRKLSDDIKLGLAVPSWDDSILCKPPIFDIGMHDNGGLANGSSD